ncbi:hypothetical protein BDW66DRAFT_154531 [Aspergillus desertorum]
MTACWESGFQNVLSKPRFKMYDRNSYHEGIIFHLNILDDNFDSIGQTLQEHIRGEEREPDQILAEYGIHPDLPRNVLIERVEHMCGDAVFKIPNYATALANSHLADNGTLFLYHFDQRFRLKNALEGTADHAHELLSLFQNLANEMREDEKAMARDFAAAWIMFCNGQAPWKAPRGAWKVWGPESVQVVRTEQDDEKVRSYARMQRILSLGGGQTWKRWLAGVDALVNKRVKMGKAT